MISCEELFEVFKKNDLNFFTGVPDSTFKEWMSFLADEHKKGLTNIIACNECEATAIASGYHLATRKIGVVYMQNSGLGKCVNPLTSLCDKEVYSIPVLLMIGWRGEPGKNDEPQHKKMGRITIPLLEVLEIPYRIVPENLADAEKTINEMKKLAEEKQMPTAIIIKSKVLEEYNSKTKIQPNYEMSREDAIKIIVEEIEEGAIISTTGKCSRELYEYRKLRGEKGKDFLTVGSMGCSASIAFGAAISQPGKKFYIFDGDGAILMQMGTLSTIGAYKPRNINHIIFDNSSYDSTGGQPTNSSKVSFGEIALACGYQNAYEVKNKDELIKKIGECYEGPNMIIVKVKEGSRKDLGRPESTPIENKKEFMEFLEK